LVADTDGVGVRFVEELDENSLKTILKIEPEGVSTSTLSSLRRNLAYLNNNGVSKDRIKRFVDDVDQLASTNKDVDGLDELIERSAEANNPGSFVGPATEAEYAAKNLDTITAVRDDIDTPSAGRPGDIDAVETIDSEVVGSEIKNSAQSVTRGDLGQISAGYRELLDNGEIDRYQFVFRELTDSEIRDYLEQNDIPYTVLNER